MATSIRTTTPPPSGRLHTPSTPKFGKDDNYEPYSPRRKSARVSQRTRPEPVSTPPHLSRSSPHSPRPSTRVAYTSIDSSPPTSPRTAPKKSSLKMPPTMGGRRVSGALNCEGAASAATALGIPPPKMESHQSLARSNGMLPTPAKTPKKPQDKNAPAIKAVARNLFPIHGGTAEEVMPSPKRKGRKRYTGFTLDSFEAEEDDTPIPIYTDSHERVPEIDTSADNPFYGESSAAVPDPTKRSSKRRKITIPGEEEEQTIDEAERRDDGLVYVFRGKKLFRRFTDGGEDASADQEPLGQDLDDEVVSRELHRPLTRSSIKPRLLFPTPQQVKAKEIRSRATVEDEEADTDIEPITPTDPVNKKAITPKAPRFPAAMASPPTTVRATRSKDVDMSSSPAGPTSEDEFAYHRRGGNNSPFDGWNQTKPVTTATKKRGGDPLIRGSGSKKTRG